MKWIKLTGAGLLTAVVLLLYFFFFENQELYQFSRCLTGAKHWQSCYQPRGVEFTTDLYGLRYEGNTRNFIDAQVLYFGAYEKPVLHFMRDVMTSVYHNQGVFLDVGANTGQHSLFMSRYATEVHAFEPFEPVVERFRKHLDMNRIKNVVIHPVGLGDKNARLPFFAPEEDNLGTGSFEPDFYAPNKPYKELEIVVGDEALKKAGVTSVALVKMDIEGFEKLALQGLKQTLIASRPIVVFELTIEPAKSFGFKSIQDLYDSFPLEYDFFLFAHETKGEYTGAYELVGLAENMRFDLASQSNVVASPKERRRQIPRKSSH